MLSLVPWAVFAALAGMGFDAGFSWKVALFVGPLWAYPVLILVCAVIAFSLNGDGNFGGASNVQSNPTMYSATFSAPLRAPVGARNCER